LAASNGNHCISIFAPTHAAGRESQQDVLRLKNLLAQAERELIDQGVRSTDAKNMLAQGRSLLDDTLFWEKRSHGLAVFLGDGVFERFRVPLELDEVVMVNRRFQLKPLLPLVGYDDRFFVLALSQNRVRLLKGSQYSIRNVDVEGLPENIDQALNYDTLQPASQVHSAMRGDLGKQAAVFHGQGNVRDVAKDDLAKYFRVISAALRDRLRDQRIPLFLAGVQYLLPIYREVSDYPYIAADELPGNPDHLSERELHDRIWPLMKKRTDGAAEQAEHKYRQLAGTGRTSDDIRRIVPAAHEGRIESLFVDGQAHCWGTFAPSTGEMDVREAAQTGDDDLLDLAAVQTLLHRGSVFALPVEQVPSPPVAAVYRY
jgi:hypothetical protein